MPTKPDPSDSSALERITEAYARFVPHQFLRQMGKDSVADIQLGDSAEKTITILFADIRNFTSLSESMTPRQSFEFINSYLERMEPAIDRFNGIIDKYIGDAIMALFPTSADDALHAAIGMLEELAAYNAEREKADRVPIAIGVGLNTGLTMLGTVGGRNRMDSTVISDAVNLASRIESMTKHYGASLLISEDTYYSLADASHHDIRFLDRVRVKGKEKPHSVYEVFDADAPHIRAAKHATRGAFEQALACYHFKEADEAQTLLVKCLDACPEDEPGKVYLERCRRFLEDGIHEGTGEVDLSIEWSPSLTVGHTLIDKQHQQLFASVNEFVQEIRKSHTSFQARSVLGFLDKYVHEHFKDEEHCMEQAGYPFLQHQKEQHARFSRYFDGLKTELEQEEASDPHFLLFRIQVFVVDWLFNHTAKLDRHFGKFLRLHKSG